MLGTTGLSTESSGLTFGLGRRKQLAILNMVQFVFFFLNRRIAAFLNTVYYFMILLSLFVLLAIFLHKRVLRSDRHGLNEEEAECYNLYLELLGHQWRFVTEQAELRLKSHKVPFDGLKFLSCAFITFSHISYYPLILLHQNISSGLLRRERGN